MRALFEPVGDYLLVEDCIRAMAGEARAAGAELVSDAVVEGWSVEGDRLVVRSSRSTWRASSVILAQGAWSAAAVRELGLELEVVRKSQLWYRTRDDRCSLARGFVPFAMQTATGQVFYGFPELDERGLKVAEHSGGTALREPLELDRSLWPEDRAPVEAFCATHLPAVTAECLAHAVCMYTRSPDEHFVVDRHPAHPRVVFAAGLSGHGFKFAPVLGEALADLALDGGTRLPIEFLSRRRFEGRR
jgi:glycine/D-amino acid oxidase-like deaminating enzyme